MKELIVVIGMMTLGCMIFNLVAGDGNSLKTAGINQMNHIAELYEAMG